MPFRIEIGAEAATLLRTLSPHLVQEIAHALAELAEDATVSQGPLRLSAGRVEANGVAALYALDEASEIIRVEQIEVYAAAEGSIDAEPDAATM